MRTRLARTASPFSRTDVLEAFLDQKERVREGKLTNSKHYPAYN